MLLTILALLMIVTFIVSLSTKKLGVFQALTLVPLAFGIIAAIATGADFETFVGWLKEGLFFKVNEETAKVSFGVISPGMTILFSILFFDVMLGVGLFDPVAEFFIKKAKGDPLLVMLSTVMVSSVVSLNGDTTTTVIICLSAFISLYKQMNIRLSRLAIIIVAPIGIWNMLPWGGPTIASATAHGLEINDLFSTILPGLLAAQVTVIAITYFLGLQERKYLGFDPKDAEGVSEERINEMLAAIRDKDPELKRPKLYAFNLILTLVAVVLLIEGTCHGSIIFMLGTAIALLVNYRTPELCAERLEDLSADALPTAVATFGAGVFSGVLTGTGMATALATTIADLIPEQLGSHMAPIYAIIAAPAICFLPQDAFYFGIASVIKDVMINFGMTAMDAAVASMVGQCVRLVSPVIPVLYMLIGECKMNFVEFQKEYVKYYGWVLLLVYLAVYGITGVLPY